MSQRFQLNSTLPTRDELQPQVGNPQVFYEPLGFLRDLGPIHLSKNYEYFKQKRKNIKPLQGLAFRIPSLHKGSWKAGRDKRLNRYFYSLECRDVCPNVVRLCLQF